MEQSDQSGGPVRPVAVQNDDDPTNFTREGPRRGKRAWGCPRLGRLANASSNAMEMRKEQYVEVGKARVKRIR